MSNTNKGSNIWGGRFTKSLDPLAISFNASITFDYKLAYYDIWGSQVHAQMLGNQGIIAQSEADKAQALIDLKANAQGVDESQWGYQLLALYLGDISEFEFLSGIIEGVTSEQEYAHRLCEAYFYLAKMHQAAGDNYLAADYFRLALATNVHEFVEYKYARLELELMAGENAS